MDIVEQLRTRARQKTGTIVLPESHDDRTLKAAATILSEGLAELILLGKPDVVAQKAAALGIDIQKAQIIDPENYAEIDSFASYLYEKRKEKGMTPEQASVLVRNELYFGTLLVQLGKAHGMVAGAVNTTADVLRASLQVIGVAAGIKTVSSCFIMVVPDYLGEDRVYLFADCAVIPLPTDEQLADIAISTANTRRCILGDEPKVALLSFSTMGSGKHELVDKVVSAKKILDSRVVDFDYDGEMQADAAIVPAVGKFKAPNSKVAGQANVLIFPDLQSGNISAKLVQRFAKAEALGPVIQGMAKPVCDLSRGCSAEDIVSTTVLVKLMIR